MPDSATKFILAASAAALLVTGCGGAPAPDASAKGAVRPPVRETKAEAPPTPGKSAPAPPALKPLAPDAGGWSASAPTPEAPLAALKAQWTKNPAASDADKTLLDIARHELARGDLKAAVRSLKRLQEKFPLSPLYSESAFYLGLALQAAGRHEEAWISLRSSLSGETDPARRALLEASLGAVYEKRGETLSALLSYARAMRSDPQIFGKDVLIGRVEALAKEIALHRLRAAAERFAGSPAGPLLRTALAEREEEERRREKARDVPPERAKAPSKSRAGEPDARPDVNAGRVGIMLPLSGPAGGAGGRVYDGIRLALRRSLAKYPDLRLQLAIRDTKSAALSAGNAAAVAAELIEREKAVALIGPLLTEAAEAAAETANRLKTPMLTPFALRMRMNPDFPWVFRNSLPNRLQARGAAAYAVRHLGLRRFAVLHPENRDGRELTHAFAQAVEEMGGEVARIVSFPENATDFREQIRALGGMDDRQLGKARRSRERGKPGTNRIGLDFEVLFVPVRHKKAVLIAPQILFYNMRGVRLLGGAGWNDPRLLEHGERYVEGAVFVDGFFAGSAEPVAARFVGEFKSVFGKTPDVFSALGYDAARIVFEALARGAKTREDVRRHLASLRGFEGVAGLTDMGADNDARRQLFVLSVQGGKIRYLQMVAPGGALESAPLLPKLSPATQ